MRLAVGVDGGGTRTRAVIIDERRLELGRAEAPGAVVTLRDPRAAAEAVAQAVRAAAARACADLPAAVLWAGLAGAGHEATRAAVQRELEALDLAERVGVGTDVNAAFHAAFPEGPGILLVAGTGSIGWARSAAGRIGRVGGWGQLLGDEGSGYALGLGALRAVARAEDGREGPTLLRDLVLRALRLSDPADLIPWAGAARKADVAALVPVVLEAEERGDAAARALVARAVADLAEHVTAILARLGPWSAPPPLHLWGGLIGEGGPLRERLFRALTALPVQLQEGRIDPEMGAAALALAMLEAGGR
ncbi:MAG TPA: BadF/BadG/BcrA/BcrD ATPase family protein [Longimicrobiales bacterium]|nr:BadF/BadG/BcrA/BcrD ATPase family protein [Longimicrobiales bacterium]